MERRLVRLNPIDEALCVSAVSSHDARSFGLSSQEGTREFYTHHRETMTRDRKSPAKLSHKEALVREILERVADKWTLLVIDALEGERDVRFTRLRERVGGVSQKMLTKTLRQLERDGLATRRVHAEVPPRVDYTLTSRHSVRAWVSRCAACGPGSKRICGTSNGPGAPMTLLRNHGRPRPRSDPHLRFEVDS
jgi:DNA-binding HxlR family transcriptional regulator